MSFVSHRTSFILWHSPVVLQRRGTIASHHEPGARFFGFSRWFQSFDVDRRVLAVSKHPAYDKDNVGSIIFPRFDCNLRTSGIKRRILAKRSIMKDAADNKGPTALTPGATEEDAVYMRMAVQLARKGIGRTSPNPMVGCVIVKDGQIVGRGFHPKAGEPHAEVFALREAGEKAKGATAYVSLEPCNHTGRTPPCSQALVKAQVKRVVVGIVDPNPLVGGSGVETLQKAGIQVVVGVEETLCKETAETFFHRITMKKPFVTLRYSMSLDGVLLGAFEDRIEPGSNHSILLQENDAVLITAACLCENPSLLSSEPGAKQPLRVVFAPSLDLPVECQVFDTTFAPTLVLVEENTLKTNVQMTNRQLGTSIESQLRLKGVDVVRVKEFKLDSVLDLLYQQGFNSVLLESRGSEFCGPGNYLGQLAVLEHAVQKLVVSVVPVIVGDKLGGSGFLVQDEIVKLQRVSTRMDKGNVIIEGYFKKT